MGESDQSQDLQFFEKQERLYPKKVTGRFRTLKWRLMAICLAIYYLTPFIRWDRGAGAPDQAVFIDMERGRAYWFWIEIWPQEVYILTGILILAAIGLFFVTSILGRVWCGYLCFQTVWTDLFIAVERFVQGDRNQRKKLREGPWSFEKFWKLSVTHSVWLFISWCTGGAFVLYFNDAPSLVLDFFTFDVSPVTLSFILGLTFMTYLMAGFAREQVCTFMCPYARFQSAMFDKSTLIIGYDESRGEPRGKHKKGADWTGLGDCVDCSACVQVCPTGIDIRDGLQMECIACGLCADACDGIMEKVGLEKGLIRYDTEARLSALKEGKGYKKIKFIRPRTIYYTMILAAVSALMLYTLLSRTPVELSVLHNRNPLFVKLSDGDIRNGYDVKIMNKTHEEKSFLLSVEGLDEAKIKINNKGADGVLVVDPDSVAKYKVFIDAPIKPQAPIDISVIIKEEDTEYSNEYETMFISKKKR